MTRPRTTAADLARYNAQVQKMKGHGGVAVTHPCDTRKSAGSSPAHAPRQQRFFVPGPLPGANDIIRKHYMVYTNLKQTWGARCQLEIVLAAIRPVTYCEIEFLWLEKHDRRDSDNVMFGQKFVLDALKQSGIIKDDRRTFIKRLIHEVIVYPLRPGVQVTITEVQP